MGPLINALYLSERVLIIIKIESWELGWLRDIVNKAIYIYLLIDCGATWTRAVVYQRLKMAVGLASNWTERINLDNYLYTCIY